MTDYEKYRCMSLDTARKLPKEEQEKWKQARRQDRLMLDLRFAVSVVKEQAGEVSKFYDVSPQGAYSALDLALKMLQYEALCDILDQIQTKEFSINVDNYIDTNGGETTGGVHYE